MEISIKAHKYPPTLGSFARPAPLISGMTLGETPHYFSPNFLCECGRSLYDGGLCQAVFCICGAWQKRFEDNTVLRLPLEPTEKCQSKGFGEVINLDCASFGVFSETIPQKFKKPSGLDYPRLLKEIIKPYFTSRCRCIESGITFISHELKFKVLSCYPQQGFVSKDTRLHLYSELSSGPLTEVEIIPLPPHCINDELFDSIFLPYFIAGDVHLHCSQHICIFGLECVVSKAEPENGYVLPSVTEFNYCEYPVPSITRLRMDPYLEDIPSSLSRITEAQMIHSIIDMYIMPFLKGWRRVLKKGMVVDVGGVDFKIKEIEPDGGACDCNTVVAYSGTCTSRRRNNGNQGEGMHVQEVVRRMEEEWKERVREGRRKINDFVLKVVPQDADQKICVICIMEFEKGSRITTFPCCKI